MNIDLLDGERIDDLQYKGIQIIQNKNMFCFGTDAVLLAHFIRVKPNAKIIELGTGNGIISVLLAGRYEKVSIDAVEIQPYMSDMAQRSVLLNNLDDRIKIICGDLRDAWVYGRNKYDAVIVNPPYMKDNDGETRKNDSQAIARKEIMCTLADVTAAAGQLLNNKGKLFMIHQAERLADIFSNMQKCGIEPKRILTVNVKKDKAPNLVLIEGVKGGQISLKWEKPLVIYDEDGNYTERMQGIYRGEQL